MGWFDKREKMDMDKASGVLFTFCITYQGQGAINRINLGIDENHKIAVGTGYLMGLSMIFIAQQITLGRVNEFIRKSMNNAKEVLLPELLPVVPKMQEYCETAKNFVLMEATDIDFNILFEEFTKRYLKDLLEGKEYQKELFDIAVSDMKFYYENIQKFVSGIKIV